jgi:hypothetical protein
MKTNNASKLEKKVEIVKRTLILLLEFCIVRIMIVVAYCRNNQEWRSNSH